MSEPTPNTSAFWMPAVALRRAGRKVRPEAVLKNLQRAAQELIVEWSNQPAQKDADGEPIAGTGGVPFALAQLKEHARLVSRPELAVSQSTLYAFLDWFSLEQDLEISFEREQQVLAKTGNAKLAREAGETLLMKLGLAAKSAKLIHTAAQIADSRRSLDLEERSGRTRAEIARAKLVQKDRDWQLAREKFEWDGAKEALAKLKELKSIAADRTLNDDQKIEQVRLRLWGAPPKEMEGKA